MISKISTRLILLLTVISMFSCKKDKVDDPKSVNDAPSELPEPTTDRNLLTKDSIYLYAQQLYYWNSYLPAYSVFLPRQYDSNPDQLENYNSILFNITQQPVNPLTKKPYEYFKAYPNEPKYSYIRDLGPDGMLTARNDEAYVDLEDKGNDMGLSLGLRTNISEQNPYAYLIYIRYTHPNSPAAKAGLGRGDYIDMINGKKYGENIYAEFDEVAGILNADPSSLEIGGKRKDSTRFDNLTISKSFYETQSVFKDTIITVSGKKIGYIAYARFSRDTAILNSRIAKFAASGVTNLVIDLRYNGGGYVSSSRHFANLIAPSALTGTMMFAQHFNSTMQKGEASFLEHQYPRDAEGKIIIENGKPIKYSDYSYTVASSTYKFNKKGNLNGLEKVVFLVSEETASASELLINNLKPHMNVKIVGKTTFGKPIGFFPIRIDHYEILYSMFVTKNANGEGDYFNGMAPDKSQLDDFTRDFGDPEEFCFADAINYITTESFITTQASKKSSVKGTHANTANWKSEPLFTPKKFVGMIDKPGSRSKK